MPLYDCMLLVKPNVRKEAILDLVSRVTKHVCRKNGVMTDLKPLGTVQLGYGIRKLDGRYYQASRVHLQHSCILIQKIHFVVVNELKVHELVFSSLS